MLLFAAVLAGEETRVSGSHRSYTVGAACFQECWNFRGPAFSAVRSEIKQKTVNVVLLKEK